MDQPMDESDVVIGPPPARRRVMARAGAGKGFFVAAYSFVTRSLSKAVVLSGAG